MPVSRRVWENRVKGGTGGLGEAGSESRSLSHLLPGSQGTIREEAKAGTGCELGVIEAPGGGQGRGGESWGERGREEGLPGRGGPEAKPERARADKKLIEERAPLAGTPSGAKAQGPHRGTWVSSQLREVTHHKSFPWVERPHHQGFMSSMQSPISIVFSNNASCLVVSWETPAPPTLGGAEQGQPD